MAELDELETEFEHFQNSLERTISANHLISLKSKDILSLWLLVDKLKQSDRRLNWWQKLWYRLKYRLRDASFFETDYNELIDNCQYSYYLIVPSERFISLWFIVIVSLIRWRKVSASNLY